MNKGRVYATWKSARGRCRNPNDKNYSDYGGRGITMCRAWAESFDQFYADMGPRPEGLTLERRDNDKGYSPENCYWATRETQQNNRRGVHKLTYQGKTMTIKQWSSELGIKPGTLLKRLNKGWSANKTLSTPLRRPLWDC